MNFFNNYPYYYQNRNSEPPPKPPVPKPSKPPPKKKKWNFKTIKKETCSSLNDVEHFLCDFNTFIKYIRLYKLLK